MQGDDSKGWEQNFGACLSRLRIFWPFFFFFFFAGILIYQNHYPYKNIYLNLTRKGHTCVRPSHRSLFMILVGSDRSTMQMSHLYVQMSYLYAQI